MPLNMKVFLCSDYNLVDCNDLLLPSGQYYFIIEHYTEKGTIKGKLITNKTFITFMLKHKLIDSKILKSSKIDYEFKNFTIITMMAKAESFLARRANIKHVYMPDYASPKKSTPKTPKFLKKKPPKYLIQNKDELEKSQVINDCSICLEKNEGSIIKLNCGHIFHRECIELWIKNKSNCPNCRISIHHCNKCNSFFPNNSVLNSHKLNCGKRRSHNNHRFRNNDNFTFQQPLY